MQSYSTKTLLAMVFCLIFSVATVFPQETKTKVEVEPETKTEPVEVKVEPSSPPSTTNDTPPVYEPPKSDSSSNSSSTSSNSKNETSTGTPSTKPRTTIRNDVERRRRRAKQKEEIERQKREARRRNKRKKDKDDYYVNCPNYDPYGDCDNYNDDNLGSINRPINPLLYFDKNDVAYFIFVNYFESNSSKYLPYFDGPLSDDNKPLYSLGFVEARPDLPYRSPFWLFYYEPDLDNFYIDFSRISNSKINQNSKMPFERMVIKAIGKTVKKVGKKFKYKRKVRPVVVEDISSFPLDRIYTFNLSYLPKGKYELFLLSRDGYTVKLDFKIK